MKTCTGYPVTTFHLHEIVYMSDDLQIFLTSTACVYFMKLKHRNLTTI